MGAVRPYTSSSMANSRLETLQQMVEQDPKGSFARYGLAMELVRGGDLDGATEQFNVLLLHNPDYAAGYFHSGQTFEKLGRIDEARQLYLAGIDVTTRTGDGHTRSELQAALDILG